MYRAQRLDKVDTLFEFVEDGLLAAKAEYWLAPAAIFVFVVLTLPVWLPMNLLARLLKRRRV